MERQPTGAGPEPTGTEHQHEHDEQAEALRRERPRIYVASLSDYNAGVLHGEWIESEAPDAQYASVYGTTQSSNHLLFLTSRQQREILVGTAHQSDWLELVMPTENTEITTISPDPWGDRFYVGTVGEGVFVYEGKTQKYVRKAPIESAITAGGGGQ